MIGGMRALVPPMLVAALAALAAGCAQTGTPAGAGGGGTVVRVVDGDTLTALIDGRREEVRLLGIDTPEVHRPDTPVQCYGPQASARTRALLPPDTSIRVVTDPSQDRRDRYGRLLAYVYREPDGAFVNAQLVRDGYARTLTIAPNVAHANQFAQLARSARQSGRGLWSACAIG
jgi:micrococcal nuclease